MEETFLKKKPLDEKYYTDKLFAVGVQPLALIYLHPTKSKLIYQRAMGFFFSSMSFFLYYWTVKYVVLYPMDITILAQIISSFGLYTLAQLKVIPVVYYNNVIRRLFESKKRFWPTDQDPKLQKVVVETYATAYYASKTFMYLVLSTLVLYMSRPFYDKGSLLTLHWFDEKYYKHVLAFQCFYALFLVCLVIGFNGLFLITITDVRAQFKILNWSIENRKNDGSKEDIRMLFRFVDHHRFLVGCVKDIEKVFMIQLLALYVLTIASCCMELYAIAEMSLSFSAKCRSLFYIATLIVQLGMFCFPAGELTNEIFTLSESLYLWNWEQGSRTLQTWLPFAIQATQQVVDFKALGLITINKMAFVDVFKSTLSFLTLMRNMK